MTGSMTPTEPGTPETGTPLPDVSDHTDSSATSLKKYRRLFNKAGHIYLNRKSIPGVLRNIFSARNTEDDFWILEIPFSILRKTLETTLRAHAVPRPLRFVLLRLAGVILDSRRAVRGARKVGNYITPRYIRFCERRGWHRTAARVKSISSQPVLPSAV